MTPLTYRPAQDAFAILFAAHHPAIQLLGMSTVHGNASLAKTTQNALSILEAIGRPEVPVFPGARKPLCREPRAAPDIHGEKTLSLTKTRTSQLCSNHQFRRVRLGRHHPSTPASQIRALQMHRRAGDA